MTSAYDIIFKRSYGEYTLKVELYVFFNIFVK